MIILFLQISIKHIILYPCRTESTLGNIEIDFLWLLKYAKFFPVEKENDYPTWSQALLMMARRCMESRYGIDHTLLQYFGFCTEIVKNVQIEISDPSYQLIQA